MVDENAFLAHRIDIGLRTGPADRQAFESAARRCYEYAQIPWHGNVIWVSSPLVLGAAAAIAEDIGLRQTEAGGHQGCVWRQIDEAVVETVERELRAACRFDDAANTARVDNADNTVQDALHGVGAHDQHLGGKSLPESAVQADLPDLEKNGFLPAVEDAVRRASGVGDDELPSLIRQTLQGQTNASAILSRMVEDAVRNAFGDSDYELPPMPPIQSQLNASGILHDARGQFWAGLERGGGLGTSFLRDVCGLELPGDLWDRARAYEETLCHSCYWYPHRRFLIVCEHPLEIHRERRRGYPLSLLHRDDGPAVSWPDGWGIYAIHGAQVPGWIIDHPEAITVKSIEDERNAEVRRIMLDRYGWARYIADSGAEIVDQIPDDHPIEGLRGARLLSKVLPDEPEPIVYLEMVNSTPSADGSRSRYLERIDPKAYDGDAGRLCHAAMASRWHHRDERGWLQRTFTRWQDYVPSHES